MEDLVILKIGGSVCTEKSKGEFRVRTRAVRRIGKEIVLAREKIPFRLVVVNGAGPFGHANVVDYDIAGGLETPRDFAGFSKTVCDCSYLNWSVSENLRKSGLVTLPYPTSSIAVQNKGRVASLSFDAVKKLWMNFPHLVPVLNGTMVADTVIRGSVLGGDSIIEHLALRLKPKKIIFATDVDGVFTKDPRKNKNAKLIKTVTKDSYGDVKLGIGGSANVDVTGGMLGKVERLLDLGTETLIVNGNVPGRVKKALSGKDVKCTMIC